MSTATIPPVTDDNLGNPLGWVYTLPLPPSQGGEVYKFTYGFVSSYSYLRVAADLAEVKKDRDHYRQKCDLLFQAGFENEECAERAELADLKHDVDRLLTACNEEAAGREQAEAELKALTAQEPDAWLTRSRWQSVIYSTAHVRREEAEADADAERIAGVDAVEVLPLYLDLRGKEGK